MERRKVDYLVIYRGEETIDLEPGKAYRCIGEVYDEDGNLHDYAVIDDSEEDYLYSPDLFDKK